MEESVRPSARSKRARSFRILAGKSPCLPPYPQNMPEHNSADTPEHYAVDMSHAHPPNVESVDEGEPIADDLAHVIPLTELAPGEEGLVHGVAVEGALGRRLQALGFVAGTRVSVVRKAPLGDPTEYELRGTRFCLRSEEASRIHVRRST